MIEDQDNFSPDWQSPPGDTIADLMRERGWTSAQLAARLDLSVKNLNLLIDGEMTITNDLAFKLATVLGSSALFWLRREAAYRQQSAQLNSHHRYQQWHDWLTKFPLQELKKAGILSDRRLSDRTKTQFVEELLSFFSIASPQQWDTLYRRLQGNFRRVHNTDTNVGAITAWLRLGEIAVEEMYGEAYYDERVNIEYSSEKFKTAIAEIRKLTTCKPEDFQKQMQVLCSNAGVILIFIPAIPKAKVSGVARWITRKNPMIQMSLFGKSNDKFWFTFFHEAAHILLHADEKDSIFLDDNLEVDSENPRENEANEFAENILIPAESPDFESIKQYPSEEIIRDFAYDIGIHPGIVVGRLQKENVISYRSSLNQLKVQFAFSSECQNRDG